MADPTSSRLITLDGSHGEGGGQVLRTALSLSLITGRPFRIVRIRANRTQPGLRPQHMAAVEAAALLCDAEVSGAAPGSRDLTFRPGRFEPRDLTFDIGTAGAIALVLQTIHLPLALKAKRPVYVRLRGGTFNTKAPSYPFLAETWSSHMTTIGLPGDVRMHAAGFYPRGGGELDVRIDPGQPRALTVLDRGPLKWVVGLAGISNLPGRNIPERMRDQALAFLAERGIPAAIDLIEWPGPGQGAAISLTAGFESGLRATFVGLGERGKPSEVVAEEAIVEFFAHLDADGAIDPHSADQLMLPLALAAGRSQYTVSAVTEHQRTNAVIIRAFLDRPITVEEPRGAAPGRVIIG